MSNSAAEAPRLINPDDLIPAGRVEPEPEPRVFPEDTDPNELAARVLAERSDWDRAMRLAYWKECRHIMAKLETPEQIELGYRRRLEMDCPECGQNKQPAGHACWRCHLPIVPSEWYDRKERYPGKKMTPEQRAAAIARLAKGRAKRDANRAAQSSSGSTRRRKRS